MSAERRVHLLAALDECAADLQGQIAARRPHIHERSPVPGLDVAA